MSLKSHVHRSGFTLVELLIALSLALMVAGTALTVMQQRQRFYRDINEVLAVRMRARDATSILATALRDASVGDSIRLATDTAVELFTTIGVGVVCSTPGSLTVILSPDSSTSIAPTALLTTPDSLDAISVFHDSTLLTPTRGWTRYPIAHTSHPLAKTVCPLSSGFSSITDITSSRRSYEFLLATMPAAPVRPGAPVRIIRRVRYSLYRSSDGLWYLGYRRCELTGCTAIQPVSGPYAGSSPPLTFRYYTAKGVETPPSALPGNITRIDIVAHAATPSPVKLPGAMNTIFVDSSVTTIALRNAP